MTALSDQATALFDPLAPGGDFDPSYYQHERYLGAPGRNPALTIYYALKPLLPRSVQLRLRRIYARRQAQREFPAWPIEPILVDELRARVRAELLSSGAERLGCVGLWPGPYTSACVLTHDVEGPGGFANIERLVELELRHGLRSSWNFVGEDYATPAHIFGLLRDAGCEIGLHGIRHDGKLFQSRGRFLSDLPRIHQQLQRWEAVGFRSPATHRNADWMHELGALYDSSYPDTDPFEPQPGGCCSILPFMFGDVVELPLTLVQDHTLWEILGADSIALWTEKADWIVRHNGLVNLNTHPDYFTSSERFDRYEEFLRHVAAAPGCWRALPREVAAWWRTRVTVSEQADAPTWWARLVEDEVSFEL